MNPNNIRKMGVLLICCVVFITGCKAPPPPDGNIYDIGEIVLVKTTKQPVQVISYPCHYPRTTMGLRIRQVWYYGCRVFSKQETTNTHLISSDGSISAIQYSIIEFAEFELEKKEQ